MKNALENAVIIFGLSLYLFLAVGLVRELPTVQPTILQILSK